MWPVKKSEKKLLVQLSVIYRCECECVYLCGG